MVGPSEPKRPCQQYELKIILENFIPRRLFLDFKCCIQNSLEALEAEHGNRKHQPPRHAHCQPSRPDSRTRLRRYLFRLGRNGGRVPGLVGESGVKVIRGPSPCKGAQPGEALPASSLYGRDPDDNLLEWMIYL